MQQEDLKKQVELERLMTAAHVHRHRGDYGQAVQAIRRVLDLEPDNPDAREFAADMLFAKGELEAAAEEYKRLFTEDRARTAAEEKYARAIVQIAEGKRQKELLREMIEHPAKFRTPARNPLYAAMLSLAPGFGHAYCGQVVKGAVLFVGAVAAWIIFITLAPHVPGPSELDPRALAGQGGPVSWFFRNLGAPALAFACIAVFLHIYALIDAPVIAGKLRNLEGEACPEQNRRTPAEPQ